VGDTCFHGQRLGDAIAGQEKARSDHCGDEGGGRREAADLVQVDDLEREDQPIAEEADRIPCL
jgi:hypothetical protein